MKIRHKKTKVSDDEHLSGREYTPSGTKLDPDTKPRALKKADRKAGYGRGDAEANGVDYDAGAEVAYEQVIDKQKERQKAETTERYHRPIEAAEKTKIKAEEEAEDAKPTVEELTNQKKKLEAANETDDSPRGPLFIVLLLALITLGVITFPSDQTAASVLPLPTFGQLLVAVGIGAILCITAHKEGGLLHEVVSGWKDRKNNPARHVKNLVLLGLCTVGPIALIVVFGLVRGPNLSTISKLDGGEVLPVTAINVAFILVQAVAFITAVVFSQSWSAGKARRRREKGIAKLTTAINEQQAIVDDREKTARLAIRTIELLNEELAKEHAKIDEVHNGRVHQFHEAHRKKAAQVQVRRRKLARLRGHDQPAPPDELDYAGRRKDNGTASSEAAPTRTTPVADLAEHVAQAVRPNGANPRS